MKFKNLNSRRKQPKFKRPNSHNLFGKHNLFKLVGFFLLLIIITGSIFLFKNNPFQIKKVTFTKVSICVSNSEVEKIISPKSQNFFNVNYSNLEKKIIDKYPCLKSVAVKKVFPSTLEVTIIPRQVVETVSLFTSTLNNQLKTMDATPSSAPAQRVDLTPSLKKAAPGEVFVVDQEGVLFKTAQEIPNLPNINIFDVNFSVGKKLENNLVSKTLELSQKLEQIAVPVKSINIKDNSIYVDSEPAIILSLNKDLPRQLISLQLILQKAKIESRQVQKIDLRFDKVVVVYSTKK